MLESNTGDEHNVKQACSWTAEETAQIVNQLSKTDGIENRVRTIEGNSQRQVNRHLGFWAEVIGGEPVSSGISLNKPWVTGV